MTLPTAYTGPEPASAPVPEGSCAVGVIGHGSVAATVPGRKGLDASSSHVDRGTSDSRGVTDTGADVQEPAAKRARATAASSRISLNTPVLWLGFPTRHE